MGKNTRGRARPSSGRGPATGSVIIGIPSRGQCESHFARTLCDLVMWDQRIGRRHLHEEHPVIWTLGSTQVVVARNVLVRKFLEYGGDWLLMLDDDQVYPQDLLEWLIASADKDERPIVGVPVWRFASDGEAGPTPRVTHNVMDIHESGGFVEWTDELPDKSVVQVAAVGTGCLMVHRSALERMREWSVEQGLGADWCWFRHSVWQPADMAEGEDLYFCRLARMVGIPVFVSTFTTLPHVKSVQLSGPVPGGLVTV